MTATASLSLELRSIALGVNRDGPLTEAVLHRDLATRLLELAERAGRARRLEIRVCAPAGDPHEQALFERVVRAHFSWASECHARQVREIFRQARHATLAGLPVVALLLGIASQVPEGGQWLSALRESLTIFAWVTMWRPAELWLFEHMPVRRLRALTHRLASADIHFLRSPT
jgi:hypothetical protein